MEPISQQEVIKQIFCSLIVEKYRVYPGIYSEKGCEKTKDLDLSYNWPLFGAVDMRKNINFYNMSYYMRTKSVVPHLHR